MVVVFPAPFKPRNPNTCPGSTTRSRPGDRNEAAEAFRETVRRDSGRRGGHQEVRLGWILRPFAGRSSR